MGAMSESMIEGTRLDRFFFEEFMKKLKSLEEVEQFVGNLREIKDS